MAVKGKVIGAGVGLMFGPLGAAFGAYLGSLYDAKEDTNESISTQRSSFIDDKIDRDRSNIFSDYDDWVAEYGDDIDYWRTK